MKFILALLYIQNAHKRLGRFLAGQKIDRKHRDEFAVLQKQKPKYKPINTQ